MGLLDDSYTKALLHFNGADTATTFTDESGKTWTARNHAQIDTAQSVFGGASGLFDGTDDSIDTPDHADWWLDDGSNANKWTIDGRVRFSSIAARRSFVSQYVDAGNVWNFGWDSVGGNLFFSIRQSDSFRVNAYKAWAPSINVWYHIAVVKDGTNGYTFYVAGSNLGAAYADADTMPNFGAVLSVGKAGSDYHAGWIDELRISKGIARWTGNFTPPVFPYSAGGQVNIWSSE